MHADLVVIGTGLAGYTLAREWRKLDPDSTLVMLSEDDGAYYSKPMLSNALAKRKQAADLAVQSAAAMARTLNAQIFAQTPVASINVDARSITDSVGRRYSYGNLVLATGARQLRLPIPGNGADAVLSVNNLPEYAAFQDALVGIDRVAVMGPGLIGCEFANDLAAIGVTSVIIGPDKYPLERLLPEEAGRRLQRALSTVGVEWQLQTVVESIEQGPQGYRLSLANGQSEVAGLVLSAVGLRPDIGLAQQAGLEVATGICTDRLLQSSAPHIYALGDCAEIEGLVLPYIMPIMLAARALARTLTGDPTPIDYPGMPVVIKTPAHPIVVASPAASALGQWKIDSEDHGVRARFESADGELLGFVLTGGFVKEKARLGRLLPPLLPPGDAALERD